MQLVEAAIIVIKYKYDYDHAFFMFYDSKDSDYKITFILLLKFKII